MLSDLRHPIDQSLPDIPLLPAERLDEQPQLAPVPDTADPHDAGHRTLRFLIDQYRAVDGLAVVFGQAGERDAWEGVWVEDCVGWIG